MKIAVATEQEIERWSSGALADRWDSVARRTILADLAQPTEAFAHVELPKPVLHPWFYPLAARCLGISAEELATVLLGGAAGWSEVGQFVRDAYPYASGGAEVAAQLAKAELGPELQVFFDRWGRRPEQLMLSRLPILPLPMRLRFAGLDRAYRRVLAKAMVLRQYLDLDAPAILWEQNLVRLQAAVEALFDNRTQDTPAADAEGRVLPSLGDVVDACLGEGELELALRGAALTVE